MYEFKFELKELSTFLIGKVKMIRLPLSSKMMAAMIKLRQIKKRGGFHCKLVTLVGKFEILTGQLTSQISNTRWTSKVPGRAELHYGS